MSDQTEKPKGALPKGYEPNVQAEPQDQDKKIWDKYYNGEIELPDVVKEMKHYRSSEDTELETSDEDRDTVLKAWQRTQNIYGYSQQKAKPKKKASKPLESELTIKKSFNDIFAVTPTDQDQREKYLKEYEKKYLARYKKPKAKPKKLSNLKLDTDLGRLNFRKHTVTKRTDYLAKRKEYEEKYILRYMKKLEAKPKRSSSKKLDHNLISGRLNLREYVDKKRKELQTERKEYEKKYISKYKESKASIKKSKSMTESDDLGRLNFRKHAVTKLKKLREERTEYEQKYLARYNKQRKAKPKKKAASSNLYKPEKPKPKRDMKKERTEYEQKYLAQYNKQRKAKSKKKK